MRNFVQSSRTEETSYFYNEPRYGRHFETRFWRHFRAHFQDVEDPLSGPNSNYPKPIGVSWSHIANRDITLPPDTSSPCNMSDSWETGFALKVGLLNLVQNFSHYLQLRKIGASCLLSCWLWFQTGKVAVLSIVQFNSILGFKLFWTKLYWTKLSEEKAELYWTVLNCLK